MTLKVDVLLPNTSQYEVLHHFSQQIFAAFLRLGFEARLLSKKAYEETLFRSPPNFTVGFNGAPSDSEGEFLCDLVAVPHISCLVDPPYRFLNLQTSPFIHIGCDDRACVDIFYSKEHPRYFFFPHGADPKEFKKPSEKRPLDIVFLGTFIDPEKRREKWQKTYPKALLNAMEEAIRECLAHQNIHFISAFLKAINEEKKLNEILSFNFSEIFQELELYIKGRDRLDLLRSIKKHTVHVYGGSIEDLGWKEAFKDQTNLIFHKAISYDQALLCMQGSKIIINSGMKSIYGAHERVFSGLMAGALVLTSKNAYIEDCFKEKDSILTYQHKHLDVLDDLLDTYLKNDDIRIAAAEKGQALTLKNHTWDERIKNLPLNLEDS